MSGKVTYEQFYDWIRRAETEAAENPDGYKRKVGLFAWLGYGFVLGLILLTIAGLAGIVALVAMKDTAGGNAGIAKLGFVLALFGWMVASALWVKLDPPPGRRITKSEFPELFADIEALQDKLDTLPIHEVILVPEMNAFVSQTPRLGVLGFHRNSLAVGLELMLVLDRDELRAVLAHELGHLSGNHSKFAGWIYRIRRTWSNLLKKFEDSGSWGSYLIVKFFHWYVPRFDAYSFALRRLNEYEADAAAAELTSPEIAARALVKINVFGAYLERVYWNSLFRLADTAPRPADLAYAGFARQLDRMDLPEDTLEALREGAMRRETGYEDTHPALQDRLKGLGLPDFRLDYDKLDFSTSAAHAVLGDRFDKVVEMFDTEWWAHNAEKWQAQFEQVQSEKRELAELQAKPVESLDQDGLWTLAARTSKYIGAGEALPLFRAYQERDPPDPDAAMVIGRLLARLGDEACLDEWAKIPREHKHYVQAFDEATAFLNHAGRQEEAAAWKAKADARHEEVEASRAAHSGVSTDDDLVAADLPEGHRAYILEKLGVFDFIKAAWIARKAPSPHQNMPIYVIAWQDKWGGGVSVARLAPPVSKHQQVLGAFPDAHTRADPMHIFVSQYGPFSDGIAAKVKKEGVRLI